MKKQKDTFTIETVSEDLRERSAAADDSFSESRKASVTFRKVFKGFDENEVLQFIEDQEEAFKSASSIYERTLEDSKSENTLLRRENKALKQTVADLEEKIRSFETGETENDKPVKDESGFIAEPLVPSHGVEIAPIVKNEKETESNGEEIAALEAKIAELEEKIAALESENQELNNALDEAENALAELQAANQTAAAADDTANNEQLEQAQATIAELNEKLAANERALAEKETQLAAIPVAASADDSEKVAQLEAQLAAKTAECEKLVSDYETFKREAGDGAVLADEYNKQTEKLTTELAELRTVNQQQAYDYAEKLSTIETQSSTERSKISQQIKMHNYHLRQIDTLLSQLTEQFELAREAVDKLD